LISRPVQCTEVRRKIASFAGAGVVLLVSVIAGGCGGSGASEPRSAATTSPPSPPSIHQAYRNDGKPRLQVDGDSIAYLAAAEINAALRSQWDVAIDATVGMDTYLAQPLVRSEQEKSPIAEVVELGTNDATRIPGGVVGNGIRLEPPQTVAAVTGRLAQLARAFPCVVFVTVNTHNPSWSPANARAINAWIRARPHVADWDRAWKSRYFPKPDPHPNAAGKAALAALIARTVDGCRPE
jgi:hypothetical protein